MKMENGKDFNDHYSCLEMLNATPYNYYRARRSLFQLHFKYISNRGSALFSNCPSTTSSTAFKCVRVYQIQNLVERKFVEIFGRSQTNLVNPVRTVPKGH